MSAGNPWSVKGIDPRARARAKSAARREGLTMGEWLNRVILEDASESRPDWDNALEAFPGFSAVDGLEPEDDRLLRAMVNRLTERVEGAEENSSRALTGLEEAIQTLARKINEAEDRRKDETRSLSERLNSLERAPAASSLDPDVARSVETAMAKLARRIYRSESETSDRLDAVARAAEAAGEVGETARRQSENLDERIRRLEQSGRDLASLAKRRDVRITDALSSLHQAADGLSRRVEQSERVSEETARLFDREADRIEQRLRSLETRNSDNPELERRIDLLSDDVARAIADTRRQLSEALDQQARDPRMDRLENAVDAALQRVDAAERRQAENLSRIGEEITRMARAVDQRLGETERRLTESAKESRAEQALERRLDEVRQENRQAVKRMGEEVTRLGRSLAERMAQAETQSAKAVEDAASRMSEMVERLQQANAEDELESRLQRSEERTAERIEAALAGVSARLDEARIEAEEAMTPVERTMTALAERLEAIEKRHVEEAERRAEEARAAQQAADKAAQRAQARRAAFDQPPALPPEARRAAPARPDPFLVGEDAAAPQAPVSHTPLSQAPLSQAPVLRPAPTAAPAHSRQAAPKPQARPARPAPVGATADADFLAAARERSQVSAGYGYGFEEEVEREGGKGLIIGLSAAAMIAAVAALVLSQGDDVTAGGSPSGPPLGALMREGAPEQTALMGAAQSVPDPDAARQASVQGDAQTGVRIGSETGSGAGGSRAAPAMAAPETIANNRPQAAIPIAASAAPAASGASPAPSQDLSEFVVVETQTLEGAAAGGDPVARYLLGMRELEAGDVANAVPLLRRAAEQGVPAAQYRYGKLLETGEGVAEDPAAAFVWTERAAEAGHRRAMHNLGILHAYGIGTETDFTQAARWFEAAALRGLGDSQANLAWLYEQGEGVPQSPADAYAWLLIASRSGVDDDAANRAVALAAALPAAAIREAREAADGFTALPIDEAANGVYRDMPWDRPGLSAEAMVSRAQSYLASLGYRPGPADGVYGAQTREAVMAYQADQGLPRTGRLDAVLLERLERAVSG